MFACNRNDNEVLKSPSENIDGPQFALNVDSDPVYEAGFDRRLKEDASGPGDPCESATGSCLPVLDFKGDGNAEEQLTDDFRDLAGGTAGDVTAYFNTQNYSLIFPDIDDATEVMDQIDSAEIVITMDTNDVGTEVYYFQDVSEPQYYKIVAPVIW